jgi:lipoprotein-anchoring transpeptidase ErfK/SrfK
MEPHHLLDPKIDVERRTSTVTTTLDAWILIIFAVLIAAYLIWDDEGPARTPAGVTTFVAPSVLAEQPVAVPPVSAAALRSLPEATTEAKIAAAPNDPATAAGTAGTVAHNREPLPVFTAPGGVAFARLPVRQLGSDTWLPVIAEQPGWVQVLLPSRPNHSTGWLDATRLQKARTSYEIRINLTTARLHLIRDGQPAGQWPVSSGTSHTPTPTGRTFLLASITDPKQRFSPVILPLGTHSTTLDTYAGGPGTVGIHTWPARSLTTRPASHGCIRVPAAALTALTSVPLGTLVHIDQTSP